MQLLFDRKAVEEMQDRHIVLELDTFMVNGQEITVYCLVPPDKVALGDLPTLEENKRLHEYLIENLKNKNNSACQQALEHLLGKFGGELDTFYTEVMTRLIKASDM